MCSTDNLGFERTAADDGIHNGDEIATNFTSRRTDMSRRIIDRLKRCLERYDTDMLLSELMLMCGVLIAGAYLFFLVIDNYGGLR